MSDRVERLMYPDKGLMDAYATSTQEDPANNTAMSSGAQMTVSNSPNAALEVRTSSETPDMRPKEQPMSRMKRPGTRQRNPSGMDPDTLQKLWDIDQSSTNEIERIESNLAMH